MSEIKIQNTNETLTAQNLVKEAKKDPSRFARPEFYKPAALDALALISALWVGHAYAGFLENTRSANTLVVSLGVFAVLSTLQVFCIKSFRRRAFVIALEILCMLIPFRAYDAGFLFATAVVMLFFIAWGEVIARNEIENNMGLRFIKSARPALTKLTTALALFMIILYLPRWNQTHAFIPQEGFRNFYGGIAELAHDFYPEVTFNGSFSAFTKSLTLLEFQKNDAFNKLNPAEREKIIQQAANQIAADINKTTGLAISPAQATSDVFYAYINAYLKGLKERFGDSFVLAWALLVFLIIRGFGTIFYWATLAVAFMLYELLLASNAIHITGVSRTHEVVEF